MDSKQNYFMEELQQTPDQDQNKIDNQNEVTEEKEGVISSSEGDLSEESSDDEVKPHVQQSTIENIQEDHLIKDGKIIKRTTKLKKTPINIQKVMNKQIEQQLLTPQQPAEKKTEFNYETESEGSDEESEEEEQNIEMLKPQIEEEFQPIKQEEQQKNSDWEEISSGQTNEKQMKSQEDEESDEKKSSNEQVLPEEKQPQIQNKHRVSFRKPQENEYVFQDLSDEGINDKSNSEQPVPKFDFEDPVKIAKNKMEDESQSFITLEDDNLSQLSDDINRELLKNLNQDDDEEKWNGEKFQKGSMPEVISSMVFFTIILCLSICLWVILFRGLIKKNTHVKNLVYDVPTLKVYHEKYTEFFNRFDKNQKKLFETENILENEMSDLTEVKNNIVGLLTNQENINRDFKTLNQLVTHSAEVQVDLQDNQRMLGKQENIEKIKNIQSKLVQMKENLETMKTLNDQVKNQKQNSLNKIYDSAIKNLKQLYRDSFDLVDLYGEFYVMTNRIWVTTENIIQLFMRRSKKIQNEMTQQHIQSFQQQIQNINLDLITYDKLSRISSFKTEVINIEQDMILDCNVELQVDNSDMNSLHNKFTITLVEEKGQQIIKEQNFEYQILGVYDHHSFKQRFLLSKGKHSFDLFAQVKNGNANFKYIDLKCLQFIQYPKWPEYEPTD